VKVALDQYARIGQYTIPLARPHGSDGAAPDRLSELNFLAGIDFLPTGVQNSDYGAHLAALNWDNFYAHLRGGDFFGALAAHLRRNYDYTLIDSPTGRGDLPAICTNDLPDVVVDCFTMSEQSIEGTARFVRDLAPRSGRTIRILPVPMRIDVDDEEVANEGRRLVRKRFDELLDAGVDRERYWSTVAVPRDPRYANEERLAVFADEPGRPGTLLSAYEAIASYATGGVVRSMPALDRAVRAWVNDCFQRPAQ
jgi:cellulose biosynthesis protein BcsQ